jgi:hypothetical protein
MRTRDLTDAGKGLIDDAGFVLMHCGDIQKHLSKAKGTTRDVSKMEKEVAVLMGLPEALRERVVALLQRPLVVNEAGWKEAFKTIRGVPDAPPEKGRARTKKEKKRKVRPVSSSSDDDTSPAPSPASSPPSSSSSLAQFLPTLVDEAPAAAFRATLAQLCPGTPPALVLTRPLPKKVMKTHAEECYPLFSETTVTTITTTGTTTTTTAITADESSGAGTLEAIFGSDSDGDSEAEEAVGEVQMSVEEVLSVEEVEAPPAVEGEKAAAPAGEEVEAEGDQDEQGEVDADDSDGEEVLEMMSSESDEEDDDEEEEEKEEEENGSANATPKGSQGANEGAGGQKRKRNEQGERGARGARSDTRKQKQQKHQKTASNKGGGKGGKDGKVGRAKKQDKFIPECKFWENGACNKGDECPFAHIGMPQRKRELCSFFQKGTCVKGDACMYAHARRPCAFHHLRPPCTTHDCKYSHDSMSAAEIAAFKESHEQRHAERGASEAMQVHEVAVGNVFNPFAAGS